MQNIFQDIKDRVDFKDLVRYYGLDVNRGGFACCPFHNERTPSFKVYEDHYHCFGCGEHGDHIDFVQKLYGISNIEAAKKISQDYGLGLFDRDFAVPVNPILKQKNDYRMWLKNAEQTVCEYSELLEHWEKIYCPRSPIDEVSPRYLEAIKNRHLAEFYLEQLRYGTKEDKLDLYKNGQDYFRTIKERLDRLDTVSRRSFKRAM